MATYCGCDCSQCTFVAKCPGCIETQGRVFSKSTCPFARCSIEKGHLCAECTECSVRLAVIDEINALHIPGMPQVTELYALWGAIINLPYPLPNGDVVRFWDDNTLYLGTQLPCDDGCHCFGVGASDEYILISRYGENGANPEIVLFTRRAGA